MGYLTFKFLHVLGAILLIGNVTVTAVWKVFADRTRNASIVEFSQRLVTGTDWVFTGGGIVLIVAGGYGMAVTAHLDLMVPWLAYGQIAFVASGLIWMTILVPVQIRQARLAKQLLHNKNVEDEYFALSRRWLIWGVISTIPLVFAVFVMITKLQ